MRGTSSVEKNRSPSTRAFLVASTSSGLLSPLPGVEEVATDSGVSVAVAVSVAVCCVSAVTQRCQTGTSVSE